MDRHILQVPDLRRTHSNRYPTSYHRATKAPNLYSIQVSAMQRALRMEIMGPSTPFLLEIPLPPIGDPSIKPASCLPPHQPHDLASSLPTIPPAQRSIPGPIHPGDCRIILDGTLSNRLALAPRPRSIRKDSTSQDRPTIGSSKPNSTI